MYSTILVFVVVTVKDDVYLRRDGDMNHFASSSTIKEGIGCDGRGGGYYSYICTAAAGGAITIHPLYISIIDDIKAVKMATYIHIQW